MIHYTRGEEFLPLDVDWYLAESSLWVAHADGSVWLECPSATAGKPALRRLLSLDFIGGHTRRLVVGAPATTRAA